MELSALSFLHEDTERVQVVEIKYLTTQQSISFFFVLTQNQFPRNINGETFTRFTICSQKMTNKATRISISIPTEDHAVLQDLSKMHGVSISWIMRKAIKNMLSESEPLLSPQSRKKAS